MHYNMSYAPEQLDGMAHSQVANERRSLYGQFDPDDLTRRLNVVLIQQKEAEKRVRSRAAAAAAKGRGLAQLRCDDSVPSGGVNVFGKIMRTKAPAVHPREDVKLSQSKYNHIADESACELARTTTVTPLRTNATLFHKLLKRALKHQAAARESTAVQGDDQHDTSLLRRGSKMLLKSLYMRGRPNENATPRRCSSLGDLELDMMDPHTRAFVHLETLREDDHASSPRGLTGRFPAYEHRIEWTQTEETARSEGVVRKSGSMWLLRRGSKGSTTTISDSSQDQSLKLSPPRTRRFLPKFIVRR